GNMYRDGKGVKQDYAEAVKFYQQSIKHGTATCELGELYFKGLGVKQDEREAARLWQIPLEKFDILKTQAAAGNSDAQFQLGEMYSASPCSSFLVSGIAQGFFEKASEQDNLRARNRLVELLSRRNGGVTPELAKIVFDSAEKGDAEAQQKVGSYFRDGITVKKDIRQAEKWFRRAAEQGSVAAQSSLGFIHLYGGENFEKNLSEAYFWLGVAVKSGSASSRAIDTKQQIEKRLSPDVKIQVDARIEKWLLEK
ncbi:MAG: tetratricopeptide repeat protein, partial [Alphaproteobacteria bacterium]